MDDNKIQSVLSNHKLWLADSSQGERANLRGTDLTGADLIGDGPARGEPARGGPAKGEPGMGRT